MPKNRLPRHKRGHANRKIAGRPQTPPPPSRDVSLLAVPEHVHPGNRGVRLVLHDDLDTGEGGTLRIDAETSSPWRLNIIFPGGTALTLHTIPTLTPPAAAGDVPTPISRPCAVLASAGQGLFPSGLPVTVIPHGAVIGQPIPSPDPEHVDRQTLLIGIFAPADEAIPHPMWDGAAPSDPREPDGDGEPIVDGAAPTGTWPPPSGEGERR